MKIFITLTILLQGIVIYAAENDSTLRPVSDPMPILEDLQRKMSSVKSVYFEFEQQKQMQLFAEPQKSEGVMLIERPDRIRWETTAPFQSIMLGNQKSVAQFEKTDDKWTKLRVGFPQMLKRVMEQMSLMHQGKLDALTSDFNISVATGAVAVVTMVPKDENVRSMLASLDVKFEPDFSASKEVVMHESNGDFARIIFRREKRDLIFPPAAFDQNKPADVTAIKAAAGVGK